MYGHSWSCPPAVGTKEECEERCLSFSDGFIFSSIAEVDDITDLAQTLATKPEHEDITRQIRDRLRERFGEVLALSADACSICGDCAYPEEACRHPERNVSCNYPLTFRQKPVFNKPDAKSPSSVPALDG